MSGENWDDRQGVSHVVIPEGGDYSLGELPEGMVVYWWNDRPVGHEFVGREKSQASIGRIDSNVLSRISAEEERASQPVYSASVIVCTRDRPAELRRCLASLSHQTYPAREIIVVDNAPRDDRTKAVARAAHAIYVREDREGLDHARNAGARRATSDIVAFADDDVIVHSRWLERLVAAFDQPELGSVMGLVLPAELATEAQRHFETYWSFGRGYFRRDFDAASFATYTDCVFPAWTVGAGASMAFRREIFDRVGFFDERLDAGQAGCSGDRNSGIAYSPMAIPVDTSLGRWPFISTGEPWKPCPVRSSITCEGTPPRYSCNTNVPASPPTERRHSGECRASMVAVY